MKLLRYGPRGTEKPGVLDNKGNIRDLSGIIGDLAGETLANLDRLTDLNIESLPVVEGNPRLGACVSGTGKFMCIGLNYADHAEESGLAVPSEPVLFMKATSAICGPNDPILIPRNSGKTDWEVELGVVIGKKAKYVDEADAMDHVAGFCVINDVSERAYQIEREGQWTKGKSCDTFGPTGPWLVTKDEVAAFREVFTIPEGEEKNAGRLFNLARTDVAGFEDYAYKIKAMYADDTAAPLCDLLEGLFHIALADGYYHPNEDAFLRRVSDIFGLGDVRFKRLRAQFVPDAERDPYDVLGVTSGTPMAEIRKAWRQLVRDTHPDRMMARGVPEEAVKMAEKRMIAINRAWEDINNEKAA